MSAAPSPLDLGELGWGVDLEECFGPHGAQGLLPGRVAEGHRGGYLVWGTAGELRGEVSGRLRHAAASPADFPAVGDFVAHAPVPGEPRTVIHAVLPRRSCLSRRAPGEPTLEQVVAANVDTVFLITSLDRDFSPRRLERYLVTVRASGAAPVILLNKADLCTDVPGRVREAEDVAAGAPVHALSARGDDLGVLGPYLLPRRTVALVGSSGVGKSTLVNRLLGDEVLETAALSTTTSRGRHTTARRSLLRLPGGALVMDTPGLRELQLWDASEGLPSTFEDIEALAEGCGFRDCRHRQEPRCAVQDAVRRGDLAEDRLLSYAKMEGERAHATRQQDLRARLDEKARIKALFRSLRTSSKLKRS